MSGDRLRLELGHSHFDILFTDGLPIATAYTDRDGKRTTRSSKCLEAELLAFAEAICRRLKRKIAPVSTMITQRRGTKTFLCIEDRQGNETVIAQFVNDDAVRLFNEAVAIAKASAHAAGASGI